MSIRRTRPIALGFFISIFIFSQLLSQNIENFENDSFRIQNISLGAMSSGMNEFSAVVFNRTDTTKVLTIDLRTESLGLGRVNWQYQYFLQLPPRESKTIERSYEISGPLLSRIILKFGEAERYLDMEAWIAMTALEREKNPFPKSSVFWTKIIPGRRDADSKKTIQDAVGQAGFFLNKVSPEKLSRLKSSLPEAIRLSRAKDNPGRERLRRLFRADRDRPGEFDYRKEPWNKPDAYAVSVFANTGVFVEPFSIAGDAGNRVSAFFATAQGDVAVEKPLILLLSGNPPGTKESLAAGAAFFASLGYHAVGVDRRPSARLWNKKDDFLSYLSDPVFDTLRLIDFLTTQSPYKISKIGLYGFSAGAKEGSLVASLEDRIDAAVLACGMVSHDWLFKDEAWVPTYSGLMIFPELGLGNPDIGHLTSAQWQEYLNKLKPEHNLEARKIFTTVFPFFEDLNPARVVPLTAPVPLMLVTGAQDEQFRTPGVVEVDEAAQKAFKEWGFLPCSEFVVEPRSGHTVDVRTNSIIAAFFARWIKD
jgi:hypothetical protein